MLQRTKRSAWRRSALLLVAALLAMTVMAGCGNSKKEEPSLTFSGVSEGEVVATYKDGKVTKPEFDKYMAIFGMSQQGYEQILALPQFQQMILEQYVSYKVLASKASEDSLKEAREEADKQLEQYKEYKKSDETLAAKAKEKGISDNDMATFLMITSAAIVHINSQVTEEDEKASFEEMKADFAVSTVRHILVQTMEQDPQTGEVKEVRTSEEALERANEVKAKLDAGGDWDALAKEYSDDPGSKDKGGLYEKQPGGNWVEAFKLAAYEQEIGVIGEPVETEYGYHVMKVEEREVKDFDQLTDTDKEQVKAAAAYKYMEKFMNEEMPKQELEITLPEPEQTEEEGAGNEAGAEEESKDDAADSGAGNTEAGTEEKAAE
ncbi:peptidylprolyl isomerase [Paenibacillus chungangensis]|uniref:Peptidylprolyl isomerase n=1 Tax=Paenibacillus chungangensis TaxID=696535 RepID=A0ABW3HX48_9BACL